MIRLQFDRMKAFVEMMQPYIEKYKGEHKNVYELNSTVCYDEYELYKFLFEDGEIKEKFDFAIRFAEYGDVIRH